MNADQQNGDADGTVRDAGGASRHRDLAYLHPDTLTFGGVGVFSGDWELLADTPGYLLEHGYIGTLIDWWNGWAVFTCTREVAEAIVAQQDRIRAEVRAALQAEAVGAVEEDVQPVTRAQRVQVARARAAELAAGLAR